MPIFEKEYFDPDISSHEALYQAFIDAGVPDAILTLNGTLKVSTATGDEAQCDAAVAAAATGTLTSNKSARTAEVKARTEVLLTLGVETWSAGQYTELDKNAADGYYTEWQYFNAHPAKLTANTPYAVSTLDGHAVLTSTLADIEALAERAADRLVYLYTAVLNGDTSQGEMQIAIAIAAAADQTALDAIVDTRT